MLNSSIVLQESLMAFKDVDKQVSFPKLEEKVLETWKKDKLFEKSLKKNENTESYIFYDGPPFATGLPHYGHILPGFPQSFGQPNRPCCRCQW